MLWSIIITALVAYVLYINVYKPLVFWRKRGVPYARPIPFIGNSLKQMLRLQAIPDSLVCLYKKFPNERYFGMYTFTRPAFCIKDPELIKQVTIKDFDYFTDHLVLVSRETEPFFGGNLFSLRGKEWREMRSTLSPAFTGSKMRGMFLLMRECAENFAQYFDDNIKGKLMTEVELKSVLTKYANDVIASASFGIKCDSLANENNKFYRMGLKVTAISAWMFMKLGFYYVAPALMNFFKVRIFPREPVDYFQDTVKETVKTREEQNIYRPDAIQLLLEARKGLLKREDKIVPDAGFAAVNESKTGKYQSLKLTDDDIAAQTLIFFLAAFETSATTMCFMMLELALNRDVQLKLQSEIDETMIACNGQLTYDVIAKMSYLDQVVSETLRKWSPGFQTDRLCVEDYTIDPVKPEERPVTIPKGMQVLIPIRAIHNDPKYYPNPDKFDPDRFSEENKHSIIPGSYMPFGAGPRNCIGSRFALLETKVMAVYLLHKFELLETWKTPVQVKLAKSVATMAPKGGFWVGLKKREL